MRTHSGLPRTAHTSGGTQTPVLILGGDATSRELLRGCLSAGSGSYAIGETSTVHDAVNALDAAISRSGLLLVDFDLGAASCVALLETLRTTDSHPWAVVFVSDVIEATDLEALLAAGADDVIAKQNLTPAASERTLSNALVRARLRVERATKIRLLRERLAFEGRLIGMVGHDLRTPLSSLLMSLDSLQADPSDDGPCIDIAKRSAERIRDMASQLLDLTRIRERASFPLERAHVALAPLLTQVVQEHRMTSGREIRLHAEDLHGWMDASAIGQLVSNLVANAIAHGDATQPVVVDGAMREGSLVVSVTNKGTLDGESALEDIFDPFTRGSTGDGLGLGLYIVRSIIDSHEGDLEVSSGDGKTRFVARWPVGGDERPTAIPPRR